MPKLYICIIICLSLSACASVDKNAATALSSAGTVATQAVSDQSKAAKETIESLPEWWGVRGALVCANSKGKSARETCINNARKGGSSPALEADLQKISDVMEKRSSAALALRSAYQSFGNLVAYDASAEVQKSMSSAFAAINSLLAAAQKLSPAASLPPIGTTFTNVAGRAAGFLASEYQTKQILAANHDLRMAVDSLSAALAVERNKAATESLLATLSVEQSTLYSAFVQSGLISPKDALGPLAATVAPGVSLAESMPERNSDVIIEAAILSFNARTKRKEAAVIVTYDSALSALQGLSSQHARLEDRQSIDVSTVLSDAQSIVSTLVGNQNNR